MTNIDRAEQVIQGLVDHPETPEIVAQALADAGLLAPALPHGWRLADHPKHGRVIVTTPEPDSGGEVAFVRQNDFWDRKYSGDWCKPDELTYIDTEPEADQ